MSRWSQKLTIVQEVINLLTDNEDYRQDLWVCYLSGLPLTAFLDYLNQKEYLNRKELQVSQLWHYVSQNNPNLLELLQNLSDKDHSIILQLILGNNISTISGYKGISQVCIQRIIDTTSKKIQDEPWLSKNTLQTKKNTA